MDSPLDSAAAVLLLFLGLVVLRNWRNGTLGQWAKAKFFLQASGTDPASGQPNTGSDPGNTTIDPSQPHTNVSPGGILHASTGQAT